MQPTTQFSQHQQPNINFGKLSLYESDRAHIPNAFNVVETVQLLI
jgi:hypothetical protein